MQRVVQALLKFPMIWPPPLNNAGLAALSRNSAPMKDPEGRTQTTYPGEGRFGLALTISLAAPFAAINVSTHSAFEDGTVACPDLTTSLFWDDETGEVISAHEYLRNSWPFRHFMHSILEIVPVEYPR